MSASRVLWHGADGICADLALGPGKDLMRKREASVGEIARRVGYRSASAFSVAFPREVGVSPARHARDVQVLPDMAAEEFAGAIA